MVGRKWRTRLKTYGLLHIRKRISPNEVQPPTPLPPHTHIHRPICNNAHACCLSIRTQPRRRSEGAVIYDPFKRPARRGRDRCYAASYKHRATTQTRGHPTVLLRFVHTRTHVHVLHIPRAHGDVAPPTEDPPSLPVPSLPVTRSQTRRHTRTNVSGRYYHSCAPHALIGTFAAAVTGSITYHGHTFRRKCVLSVRPIMPCWEIRRRGM